MLRHLPADEVEGVQELDDCESGGVAYLEVTLQRARPPEALASAFPSDGWRRLEEDELGLDIEGIALQRRLEKRRLVVTIEAPQLRPDVTVVSAYFEER